MAIVEFELIDGLAVGEGDERVVHRHITLRTLTAGDLEACGVEAEQVLNLNGDPVIVVSPVRMSNAVLRRQILQVGNIVGPLHAAVFGRLTAVDLELIQGQAELLDEAGKAALDRALKRGRSDGSAGGN